MNTDRCPTCRRRLTRSSEANRRLWALYHAAADKLRPQGQAYSAETWHVYYKSRFLGCTDYTLPSGKVLPIPRSSSELDVSEFGAFMDQVEADLNQRGVFLEDAEWAA